MKIQGLREGKLWTPLRADSPPAPRSCPGRTYWRRFLPVVQDGAGGRGCLVSTKQSGRSLSRQTYHKYIPTYLFPQRIVFTMPLCPVFPPALVAKTSPCTLGWARLSSSGGLARKVGTVLDTAPPSCSPREMFLATWPCVGWGGK